MKKTIIAAAMLSMLATATVLTLQQTCSAAEATGAAPQINVSASLTENLAAFKGKAVTITLSSGQAISGIIKDEKNGLLHLEKLSQKEFYDAIIVIEKISAVEVRVK